MSTFAEAWEATVKLQRRIDADSLAGAQLGIIAQYLSSLRAPKISGTTPYTVIVDEATEQDRKERRSPRVTVAMSGELIEMSPVDMAKLRESIRTYDGAPK